MTRPIRSQLIRKVAREQRAERPRPVSHRGHYEDDCGLPGPPPNGNGRAAFAVPRLDAPHYLPGERVIVALPRDGGRVREAWTCEVFGVQLPLVPTDPASVRVRLVERFRSAPPVKLAGKRAARS